MESNLTLLNLVKFYINHYAIIHKYNFIEVKMTKTKPKIAILATGGTIAGVIDSVENVDSVIDEVFVEANSHFTQYSAGVMSIKEMLDCMPQIYDMADIITTQIANIDSADMCDRIWLNLAREVDRLLIEGIDGIVITHGTDTMEESAYFLQLTTKSNKPIIFVGAMRAWNDKNTDGYKNLYNAVILACNPQAKGVLVTMNDRIFDAREAIKIHTSNIDAFSSSNHRDLGYIVNGEVFFYTPCVYFDNKPFDISTLSILPKVDILYTYSNDGSAIAAQALFDNGTKGLVIAGSGAGSIHKNQKEALEVLIKKGLRVVVSSHVGSGKVQLSQKDTMLGFISAGNLNPQKARILLMLALTTTNDTSKITQYFLQY